MKKTLILVLVFMFTLSPDAEAKVFDFGRNIKEKQKASVISLEQTSDCGKLEKIEKGIPEKINSFSFSSQSSLTEKTSELQKAWAEQDSFIYKKRQEIKKSISEKFDNLKKKVDQEKMGSLLLFEKRIFESIEKRNLEIDNANENYRNAIISYLSEYNIKKLSYFDSFEKDFSSKIAEAKSVCKTDKNFKLSNIEKIMEERGANMKSELGGNHFRDFAETKRNERNQKILEIKETFEKETDKARADFTDL